MTGLEQGTGRVRRGVYSMMLLLLVLAVGCNVSEGGEESGGIPPKPPSVIEGDWTLLQPDPYVVEPGMSFEMTVTGLTVPPSDVVLWLENDIALYPRSMRLVKDGGDDDSYADDTYAFEQFVPYVQAGSHRLSLGTVDATHTGEALLYVVIPERRLPRETVASVIQTGLTRTLASIRSHTFESTNPEQKAFMEARFGAEGVQALRDVLDGTEEVAKTFSADYMKLEPTQERALQAMLYNTGLLHWAEPKLDEIYFQKQGTTAQALKVTGPFDANAHPIHQSFFELDLTSAIAGAAGEAVGIVEIAFAATGVGAPVSTALSVANFVNAVVQVLIDNFMPTDLVAVEAQDQRSLLVGEPSTWIYWGTFEPENGSGDPLSLDTIAAEIISAAIPGGNGVKKVLKSAALKQAVIKGAKAALGTLLARTGVAITERLGVLEKYPPTPVKMVLDMQAYSFKISSVLEKLPILGPVFRSMKNLLDIELSQSVDLDTTNAPTWAEGADLDLDYETDQVTVTDVTWPSGTDDVWVGAKATLFTYKTRKKAFGFIRYPGYDTFELTHDPVQLRRIVDPSDLNADKTDEDFVLMDVYSPQDLDGDPVATQYVEVDTEPKRVYRIKISDLVTLATDTAAFSVTVNGVAQKDYVSFSPKQQTLDLALSPGENTVTVGCELEHAQAGTYGKHIKIGVEIPQGENHTAAQFWLDEGESHTLRIWTPPAVTVGTSQ